VLDVYPVWPKVNLARPGPSSNMLYVLLGPTQTRVLGIILATGPDPNHIHLERYIVVYRNSKKYQTVKTLSVNNYYLCEVSGSHGGEYEVQSLQGCTAVL
jgi:hypothetical protein